MFKIYFKARNGVVKGQIFFQEVMLFVLYSMLILKVPKFILFQIRAFWNPSPGYTCEWEIYCCIILYKNLKKKYVIGIRDKKSNFLWPSLVNDSKKENRLT